MIVLNTDEVRVVAALLSRVDEPEPAKLPTEEHRRMAAAVEALRSKVAAFRRDLWGCNEAITRAGTPRG